ncbi:MAG: hypothetical protein CVV27_04770 [Candidatus Melainabacteria bacterium HGW-Melainabacteria-1]|nr:MAG: hypothetical protein CVV27_04770 [Candidatus Melainabacteria bacterium HGW-Melainabacteria-1]
MGLKTIATLRPSLFYLLYNHGLVAPERLVWALYYQLIGSWDDTPGFTQILLAFDDGLRGPIQRLRDALGELDEEPLGHLLLEQSLLSPEQYLAARSLKCVFTQTYLGKILILQDLIEQDQLESALLFPYFRLPEPGARSAALCRIMGLIERRLWLRDYLSRADAESLGLPGRNQLPPSMALLADLMALNGDLPWPLLKLVRPQIPDCFEPFKRMLKAQNIAPESLYATGSTLRAPAIRCVQANLLTHRRLNNLLLHQLRSQLPTGRIESGPGHDSLNRELEEIEKRSIEKN